MDVIDQIKNRISIEDLVRQYVQLKPAGRNFKGLCPFHQEKSPSFIVSPEKQMAYCFGCNKGGDIFKFIEEIERVDFKEAVEILAEKAGLDARKVMKSFSPLKTSEDKNVLIEINENAAEYFEQILYSERGREALNYVEKRQINLETAKKFKIGCSLNEFQALKNELLKKGYSEKDLIASGVLSQGNFDGKTFDRFRHRLMLPIFNQRDKVVGFSARVLDDNDNPKYLNSPDTHIYNKSEVLFGFSQGKESVRKEDFVIVMEGNLDVISSFQAGVKNVVASSGTSLTVNQIQFLKRYTINIYFCFDQDNAGKEALLRACFAAQDFQVNIKIISFEEAKDPDELIKKDPNLWTQAIKEAKDYFDFYLDEQFNLFNLKRKSKNEVLKFLINLIKKVKSPIEVESYLQKISNRFNVKPEFIYEEMKKNMNNERGQRTSFLKSERKVNLEDYFIAGLLQYPDFYHDFASLINSGIWEGEYKALWHHYEQEKIIDESISLKILDLLSEDFKNRLKILMLELESKFEGVKSDIIKKDLLDTLNRINLNYFANKRKGILSEMKMAKENGDKEKELKLLDEYYKLLK